MWKLTSLALAAGLAGAAAMTTAPAPAEAGRSFYLGTGGFSLYIGPRYHRRHYYHDPYYYSYGPRYYYPKRYYKKRYYKKRHKRYKRYKRYRRHYRHW